MNTHRLLNWYERVAPWIPYDEGFKTTRTNVSDVRSKDKYDFSQSHGEELILSRDQAERLVNAIMTMPKAQELDARAKAAYYEKAADPSTKFTPDGYPIGIRNRSEIGIKRNPIETRYGESWQIFWPSYDLHIEPGFHYQGKSFKDVLEDEDPEEPPIWDMPELVDRKGKDVSSKGWWDLEDILEYNGFMTQVDADIYPEVRIWSPANIAEYVYDWTR